MAPTHYGYTAHYTFLDEALRSQWEGFRALEAEMLSFVPKSTDDFAAFRETEIERLRVLNPSASVEELATEVNRHIQNLAEPGWQYHKAFDRRHMTCYVTVMMLSHALCEALINAVLAIGLASAESEELFLMLEKVDLRQKWEFGPRLFAPAYRFPKGTALNETLVRLIQQRNAISHSKIDLQVDGKRVLKGSGFERKTYLEELRWIRRFFSLPYDLGAIVDGAVSGAPMMILAERKPIEVASVHVGA
jgi:hypothetical protein